MANETKHPLKIGIVCYPTIGGSGIVATALGRLFVEGGHEVHFISYERPVRLNLKRLNLYFHEVAVNEYALFKYPDYTLPLSVRIMEVCEAYGLDVLHVHYAVPHATSALLGLMMLRPEQRPVLIATLHGTDTNLIGVDPHYRPIIKYSMEHSDGITTVSESLKIQTYRTFGIGQPIEVIHNFYDPAPSGCSRAGIRRSLGISEDAIVFLHMSNLRPVKRFGDIIKAFARMRTSRPVTLLVLAGGDFEPYRAELDEAGIREKVIIREAVSDVAPYIEAADAGVYASETESFGLGILETLAFGRPVLGTRTGGIPEVIRENETGCLVEVGDVAAMARMMDRLAEDPSWRDQLGAAAGMDARRRFSGEKIRDSYLAYYRRLLQRRREADAREGKVVP